MFCNNCGNKLNPEEIFCTKCGARVAENPEAETPIQEPAPEASANEQGANYQNANIENTDQGANYQSANTESTDPGANYQSANETPTDTPVYTPFDESYNAPETFVLPKKKRIPKVLIALVVILAIVGGAFAHPVTRNSIMRLVMSEESYFKHVVENNTEELAEDISTIALGDEDVSLSNMEASCRMEIELGEEAKNLINKYGGSEAYEALSWLNSGIVDFDFALNDKLMGFNMDFILNNVDILSAQITANEEGAYVSIPDLTNKAIRTDASSADLSSMTEALESMQQLNDILPDPKVAEEILVRYIMCIADNVEGVKEESTTIKAGGVSQKCTGITLEVNEKLVVDSVESALKALKDDEDIEDIIKDIANSEMVGEDGNEVYDEFIGTIDDMLSDMDSLEDEIDFQPFDITFYVNNRGEIIGLECNIDGVEGMNSVNVKCLWAETGKEYGSVISVGSGGQEIAISGGGSKKGNKYNGTHTLSAIGMDILSIELKDVDRKLLDKDIFNGKVIITPCGGVGSALSMAGAPQDLVDVIQNGKIEISSTTSDKDKTKGKIALYTNNNLLCALNVSASPSSKTSFKIPKDYVDANNTSEMEKLSNDAQDNVNKVIDRLEKAGAPAKFISELR